MFESTGQAASDGGAPSDDHTPPVDVDPGRAVAAGEVAFEAVPCDPVARVVWLSEELSRLGLRVAACDFAVPRPGEEGPGEDEPSDGRHTDASPLSRVSPVLEVAPVDGVRVDVIGLLERVKSVAAAAQARVTVAFAASQEAAAMAELGVTPEAAREQEPAAGVRPEAARRRVRAERLARSSVVGQVGLARRISPARGVGVRGGGEGVDVRPPADVGGAGRG